MTDPAPPARTTLTPEERAFAALHGSIPFMPCTCLECSDVAAAIRSAEAQSRAEGRRQALEEAAQVAENPYGDLVEAYGRDEPKAVGTKIAGAIRRLAEDAPKRLMMSEEMTHRIPR